MSIPPIQFSKTEMLTLLALGGFGLVGPNGVFLYYALFRWSDLLSTLRDPVALVFIFEAFFVMGILAYYFARISTSKRWIVFVGLSLIGGLGFSLPIFLLTTNRRDTGKQHKNKGAG